MIDIGVPYKDGMEWKIAKRECTPGTLNVFVLRETCDYAGVFIPVWVWSEKIQPGDVEGFLSCGQLLRVDRSHEECCDCKKLNLNPPQCNGHVAGPSTCKLFE